MVNCDQVEQKSDVLATVLMANWGRLTCCSSRQQETLEQQWSHPYLNWQTNTTFIHMWIHLNEMLPYMIKQKLLNSQQGRWDESLCALRPLLAQLYELLFDLEMFALRNHFSNQMCPLRWKVQNPFHVTSRIRLKLAACERQRRSDTGMSNICRPTIAKVYLNLPLEMRILQIVLRFHKIGRPILTYWTKKSPNALFLSWFPVSAHLLKGNTNSRDKIRWTSGLCPPPTFLCFLWRNVTTFLNRQMIPSLWPSSWFQS